MQRPRLYLSAIALSMIVTALVFAACGSDDGGGSPTVTSSPEATSAASPEPVATKVLATPDPLGVQVSLDSVAATTVTITAAEGGTVEATAADGTRYTLEIPEDALLSDTEITMTPVTGAQGAPVEGGKLVGVDLQPEGLRFYAPATLTVVPAGTTEPVEAISFSYVGDGEDLHLYPPVNDPETLSFKVMHFSGHIGFIDIGEGTQLVAEGPVLTAEPDSFNPSDWEAQFEHVIGELLNEERNAHLRGEEGNPQFQEILEGLIRDYYFQVISDLLPGIGSDCAQAKQNSAKVLSWSRQVALLGMGETFSQESSSIIDAVVTGADNCWEEVTEPCIDHNNHAQFQEAAATARMNILLGGDQGKYNPLDPDLECEGCVDVSDIEMWAGSVKLEFSDSASQDNKTAMTSRSLNVQVELARRGEPLRNADGEIVRISFHGDVTEGTGVVDGSLQYGDSDPITIKGSGMPDPFSIGIAFSPIDCTYELTLQWSVPAVHMPTGYENFGNGGWLRITGPIPFGGGPVSIEGSRLINTLYTTGLTELPGEFFHPRGAFDLQIYDFTGSRKFNDADVTWSLKEGPAEPEEEPTQPPIGVS